MKTTLPMAIKLVIDTNAGYLLTHDAGFKTLKTIPFPVIRVITLDEFKALPAF